MKWIISYVLFLLSACSAFMVEAETKTLSGSDINAFQVPNPSVVSTNGCAYRVMLVVAHQDDDLWFMASDIKRHIDKHACVLSVYITDGIPNEESHRYGARRVSGNLAAWSHFTNAPTVDTTDWRSRIVTINDRSVLQYDNTYNPKLSKLFLGVEDPWLAKDEEDQDVGWGDLTPVALIDANPNRTVSATPNLVYDKNPRKVQLLAEQHIARYTRADLVSSLTQIIRTFEPDIVMTQDPSITTPYTHLQWASGQNSDHPSHIATARITKDAIMQSGTKAYVQNYVGYPIATRAVNLTNAEKQVQINGMGAYAPWDHRAGVTDCKMDNKRDYQCHFAEIEDQWLGKLYVNDFYSVKSSATTEFPSSLAKKEDQFLIAAIGNGHRIRGLSPSGSYKDMNVYLYAPEDDDGNAMLKGHLMGAPTIAPLYDKQLILLARDTAGDVLYQYIGDFKNKTYVSGYWRDQSVISNLATIKNKQGRTSVLAINAVGELLIRDQLASGNVWDEQWTQLTHGARLMGQLSVKRYQDQTLVVARDRDNRLVYALIPDGQKQVSFWQSNFYTSNDPKLIEYYFDLAVVFLDDKGKQFHLAQFEGGKIDAETMLVQSNFLYFKEKSNPFVVVPNQYAPFDAKFLDGKIYISGACKRGLCVNGKHYMQDFGDNGSLVKTGKDVYYISRGATKAIREVLLPD